MFKKILPAVLLDGRFCLILFFACSSISRAADNNKTAPQLTDSIITHVKRPISDEKRYDKPFTINSVHIDKSNREHTISCADIISNTIPGVISKSTGGIGSFTQLSIRGMDANRISVYLDDIPLNDCNGGLFNLNSLSGKLVNNIEVYKGVAAPELFASRSGGGIRLLTSTDESPRSAYAMAGGGTAGYKTLAANLFATPLNSKVFVATEYFSAENDFSFRNNNNTFRNTDDDFDDSRKNNSVLNFNFIGSGSHLLNDLSKVNATLYLNHGKMGIPTTNNTVSTAFYRYTNEAAQWQYSMPPFGNVAFRGGMVGSHKVSETYYPENDLGYMTDKVIHKRYRTLQVKAPFEASIKLTEKHSLLGTAECGAEEFTPKSLDNSAPTTLVASRLFAAAGLQYKFMGHWVEPYMYFRFERMRSRNDSGFNSVSWKTVPADTSDETILIGSAGFLMKAGENWRFFGSFSRQVNTPDLYQLFGDLGSSLPNPNLLPEIAHNFDAGIRWTINRFKGEGGVSFFYNSLKDVIIMEKRGAQIRWTNFDRADVLGLEINNSLYLSPCKLMIQATLQNPINRSTRFGSTYYGKLLPGQSRFSGVSEMSWDISPQFRLLYRLKMRSAIFTSPLNDDLHLIGFSAQHDILFDYKPTIKGVEASLSSENVLNSQIFDTFGFPTPGRMFFFKISYSHNLSNKTN